MNRGKQKALIGCVGLLLVFVGIVVIHHYRVKGAVERYKAQLVAKGEPIQWTDVLPPPLDLKENSAALLVRLSARLPQSGPLATNYPTGMEMIAPEKAATAWAQPWIGDLDYSNSWPEMLTDYESQKELIAEFHQLIDKPNIDHNLDYSQGFSLLLPHLASSKSCVTRLGAASICELHLGNRDEAIHHLRAMVAMAKAGRREPLLISQLVRIAIAAIAANTTWDLLQTGGLNDAQFAALQRDWLELEFFSPMEKALLMERCLSLQTLQLMRESPDEFRNVVSSMGTLTAPAAGTTPPQNGLWGSIEWAAKEGWSRTRDGLAEGAWHTSWSYTDELGMLKGNEALLEVVRLAMTNGFAINALQLAEQMKQDGRIPAGSGSYFGGGSTWSALQTMFSDSLASCDKAFDKAVRAQAMAALVTTAIALERYRLQHGDYPSTLQDLAPAFVDSIPCDAIDGAHLRYERILPNMYRLYSIGDDLVDDGGDSRRPDSDSGKSLSWLYGRDWVWPQSASEQEVQTYWEQQIDAKYNELFQPQEEIDPSTGKPFEDTHPTFYPTTGDPVINPETGEMLVAFNRHESPEERAKRIEHLARQWTAEYFHTLTNRVSGSSDEAD